jgi:hypothetical protein
MLVFIDKLAVNIPFQDDWDMIPVGMNWHQGTLGFADFWQQHSEHRLAALKGLIWMIGRLTNFDFVAEMFAGFIFAALTLVLIVDLILRVDSERRVLPWIAIVAPVSSLLLFSLVQQESWFWGTASLQLFLVNLCAVTLVWALTRWPDHWRSLTAAAACVIVAMFTEVSGLVLWVVGALATGLGPQARRQRTPRVIVWALVAASVCGAYFWRLNWQAFSVAATVWHPSRLAVFAGACLGLPLASWTTAAWSSAVGWGGGVVFCLASIAVYVRDLMLFRRLYPFLLLATYGLLVCLLIAAGRAAGPPETALTSHYAFAPTLFWIAAVVMLAAAVTTVQRALTPRTRPIAVAAIAVAIALLGSGYWRANLHGYQLAYARSRNLQMASAAISSSAEPPREVLRFLYPPDEERVRRLLAELRTYGLGPFSTRSKNEAARRAAEFTTTPATAGSDGFHDGGDCNGTTGWAWDPAHRDAAVVLDVWSGDTRLGTVTANWFRWDLLRDRKGNGQHAFFFLFPTQTQLRTGRPVTVTFADTGRPLRGSPRIIPCSD